MGAKQGCSFLKKEPKNLCQFAPIRGNISTKLQRRTGKSFLLLFLEKEGLPPIGRFHGRCK
jgi:hypothetical protein